jgi:hypothetical protein
MILIRSLASRFRPNEISPNKPARALTWKACGRISKLGRQARHRRRIRAPFNEMVARYAGHSAAGDDNDAFTETGGSVRQTLGGVSRSSSSSFWLRKRLMPAVRWSCRIRRTRILLLFSSNLERFARLYSLRRHTRVNKRHARWSRGDSERNCDPEGDTICRIPQTPKAISRF